jgi:hypothetical protein
MAAKMALQDRTLMRRHGRDGILDRATAFTCSAAEILSEVVCLDESEAHAHHLDAVKGGYEAGGLSWLGHRKKHRRRCGSCPG